MSSPPDPANKLERARRLLFFPLAMFYIAVLVVAAWPRQLGGGGELQLAANYVLSRLGWPAGMNVFSGQGDKPLATVRDCFQIVALTKNKERRVIHDTMVDCRDETYAVSKPPVDNHYRRRLADSLSHLRTAGAHGNLNENPLNALFSIADYVCHLEDEPFEAVIFTGHYQRLELANGERKDEVIVEGAHHCASGRWQPIGTRLEQLQ